MRPLGPCLLSLHSESVPLDHELIRVGYFASWMARLVLITWNGLTDDLLTARRLLRVESRFDVQERHPRSRSWARGD